jgi:ribosomal protein L40E
MGWDVGYSGDCPRCGASVHHLARDKPGSTAVWMRCPTCLRADSQHVPDAAARSFWNGSHPCPSCGGAREPWDASRCARCGQENVGKFMCMPD